MKKQNRKAPMIMFLMIMGAFLSTPLFAGKQFDYTNGCSEAYRAIFELRFSDARNLLNAEKKANPGNLVTVSLENTLSTLTLFISEDPALYNYYKKKSEGWLDLLQQGHEVSPLNRYCIAQFYLEWAFVKMKFRDYYAAALDLKRASDLFTKNDKLFPGFLLNKAGLGIVHVVSGIVPDQYRWISKFFGLKGTVKQGVLEILQVASYQGADELTIAYRSQAIFYLTFISLNLPMVAPEPADIEKMISSLKEGQRESPLMMYALAAVYMKTGRNDRAIEALVSAKTLPGRYPFYYLEYLEGVTRLNRLDFSAATNFQNYLTEFKGHNYRGSAWQRLAWISLLKGDTADYNVRITQMRSAKIRQTDEDKQAVSETQPGRYPNAKLLRARLLYDGGYYLKALDELLNTPVNTTVKSARDMVEYHYRLGRIYQALGSEEKAIVHYQVAIGKGGDDPWYFATSASLQMGLMYEKRGEWKKAEASFLSCLSFPVKEYRTSLREKAKAGIERIRQK